MANHRNWYDDGAFFTKVAVVPGGSSGIGLAGVRRLRVAGWDVAFFSQNADSLRAAAQEICEEIPSGGRPLAGPASETASFVTSL